MYFTNGKLNDLGAEEVLAYWVQENPMDAGGDAKYYWHLTKKLFHYLRKYMPFIETTEREVSDIMMDGFFKYTQGKGGPKGPGPNGGKKFSRDSVKPWPSDFQKATISTSVSAVTSHRDFDMAKAGDLSAARRLVRDLIKPERLDTLAKAHPNAVVVPVAEKEETGHNAIPRALAEELALRGLALGRDVYQKSSAKRKGKNAVERLLLRKVFDGPVKPSEYILVDDILTQGGTIHELRHFIDNNGGKSVAVLAMAQSSAGNIIAPRKPTLDKVLAHHDRRELERILWEYNVAGSLEALTESEANAIARFSTTERFRNSIVEAANELMGRGDIKTLPTNKVRLANSNPDIRYSKSIDDSPFKPVDTNSKNFKAWFGDSKVVDENGEPLVFYHSNIGGFDEIKKR
jgi:hypothetical protein